MWRNIRVFVLLVILLWAATHTWFERISSTGWKQPLWVGIFPVNADGSATAQAYIDTLKSGDFADIEDFMAREAHRYGKELAEPLHIVLYPQIKHVPPQLERGDGLIGTVCLESQAALVCVARSDCQPGAAPRPPVCALSRSNDPEVCTGLARHAEGSDRSGACVRSAPDGWQQ